MGYIILMIKYQSKFDVIRLSAGLYAYNIIFNNIQWNLSKQNLLGTNVSVSKRQVFDLYRLNL